MTTLVLGNFTFQDFEIPEEIGFGGDQRLSIKKMVGGVRDIQALGTDWRPIQWSGTFFPTAAGQSALDRALALKQIQDAAQPVQLSWDELLLKVYIRSFEPDYRFARIPYRIVCEVLQDLTAKQSNNAGQNADDILGGDLNSLTSIASSIGNSTLSNLVGGVSSAMGAVSTFVGAGQGTIASVLGPLNSAMQGVTSMISQTDSVLGSVTSVAGVLPGLPIASAVGSFQAQLTAATQQPMLLQAKALIGRMTTNLGQVNSSVRTTTVGGGNLFDVASKEYGDPTAWTQIAQANNLTDPTISGISTLVVPPYNQNASGGVVLMSQTAESQAAQANADQFLNSVGPIASAGTL
jgi:hypothetical protein